jgi:hypothetical protein
MSSQGTRRLSLISIPVRNQRDLIPPGFWLAGNFYVKWVVNDNEGQQLPPALPLPKVSETVCPFCPETIGHNAINCPLTVQERFRQTSENDNCRFCLQKGHKVASCPYAHPCDECGRYWHHVSLCNVRSIEASANKASSADTADSTLLTDSRRKVKALFEEREEEIFEQMHLRRSSHWVSSIVFRS